MKTVAIKIAVTRIAEPATSAETVTAIPQVRIRASKGGVDQVARPSVKQGQPRPRKRPSEMKRGEPQRRRRNRGFRKPQLRPVSLTAQSLLLREPQRQSQLRQPMAIPRQPDVRPAAPLPTPVQPLSCTRPVPQKQTPLPPL